MIKFPTAVQEIAQPSDRATFCADERASRAPTDILSARSLPEIELPLPEAPLEGRVVAVAADRRHHFSKATLDRIVLVEGHGVEGDAPCRRLRPAPIPRPSPAPASQSAAGSLDPIRALRVSLESRLRGRSRRARREHHHRWTRPRTDAARDADRARLTAIIELTGQRTPCGLIDRFRAGLKRHVLSSAETGPPFKSGVLGVVRSGGAVAAGDNRAGAPPVHLVSGLAGAVRARCTTRRPDSRIEALGRSGWHGRKQGNGGTLGAGEAIDGPGLPTPRRCITAFHARTVFF